MTIRQFSSDALNNLIEGLKLALLLPIARQRFMFSQQQLLAMLLLGLILDIIGDWMTATPPIEFNDYGISYLLSLYVANLLSLYLISLMHQQGNNFYRLVILQYASYPVVFLVSLLMVGPIIEAANLATFITILTLLTAWALVIVFRIIALLLDSSWWLTLISLVIYFSINMSAILYIPEQPLWYGDVSDADTAYLKAVNTENTYYRQMPLLQDALHFVDKGVPDSEEFFFLGFSSDARQDVFLKESQVVQDIVDRLFHTQERSLLLSNHLNTYADQPLANSHNLHAALTNFAGKMNNDDVLLLFLTSHGSKTYELSVNFANMQFNDLPASKLAEMLDNSGIKWRVVIISACYAGGFIDQLKNPYTLVVTAAARDRQSAGCTDKSEATWFTDAYFHQALPQTTSFIKAFKLARQTVHLREQREGMEFSNPQIFIGNEIRAKLERMHAANGD
ncbi:MAG: C13 family peptidase [Gammaproteobacteria bacterium]|nr:C13 family peptidase [Gammaproteobacteria bacterium]